MNDILPCLYVYIILHSLLLDLQVLTPGDMPGSGVDAEGRNPHPLLPIVPYSAEAESVRTTDLPDKRSISGPLWVVVSPAAVCVEHFGDSTSAAQQFNKTAGGAQASASAPAGAMPVGARASLRGGRFRASASAKKAQHFSITAASVKLELDFSRVQYSYLFLNRCLEMLPDELPENPTANDLKAVDDKIKR